MKTLSLVPNDSHNLEYSSVPLSVKKASNSSVCSSGNAHGRRSSPPEWHRRGNHRILEVSDRDPREIRGWWLQNLGFQGTHLPSRTLASSNPPYSARALDRFAPLFTIRVNQPSEWHVRRELRVKRPTSVAVHVFDVSVELRIHEIHIPSIHPSISIAILSKPRPEGTNVVVMNEHGLQ